MTIGQAYSRHGGALRRRRGARAWLLMAMSAGVFAVGCGDAGSSGGSPRASSGGGGSRGDSASARGGGKGGGGTLDGSADTGAVPLIDLPISKLPDGFNRLSPGGEAICSRGQPYSFYVRRGTTNRVVIEFRGGGGCWDAETCRPGALTPQGYGWFIDNAEPGLSMRAGLAIYDHANPENPVKDWHHVVVSYCTGDIHVGNAVVDYGDFTVHHKGAVNVRAVLDWVYKAVPDPERVFVAGCSAGGYASVAWVGHIRNHYKNAKITQLSDCGTAVFGPGSSPAAYNQGEALPTFIPGVDEGDWLQVAKLHAAVGKHFPDLLMSFYTTVYDEVQSDYYRGWTGNDAYVWAEEMRAFVLETASRTPSFRSFLAPNFQHCVLPSPNLYEASSNGVRAIDWLRNIVDGVAPENVDCAPNCGSPSPRPDAGAP